MGPIVQAGSIGHVWVRESSDRVRVPRQLPMAVRDFTGRGEYLAALDALLTRDEDSGRGAVLISALDGTAGVGKTALAVHWAHGVQHRFPGGTLYVNLRGYGPDATADPRDVLGGSLDALGVQRVPAELESRAALYRSALAGRRVLVVLDNAGSAGQVRPLLPGEPGCLVVVTSRASLTSLVIGEGATPVTLDLPTPAEALELVRTVLGDSRADAEPEAVAELVETCARLPLALRIAAGRVAARPHLTLAELVTELRSDPGRWDALSVPTDENTAVWSVFGWSYHLLGPAQARMFRRLGLHPGPEIGVHAAAALAGTGVTEAKRLLDALVEAHMIEPIARDRYRLHDLLRAYAAGRMNHDESPKDHDEAIRAVVEWYVHHSVIAAKAIVPVLTDWFDTAPPNSVVTPGIRFADAAEAWAWAEREEVNAFTITRAAEHHALDWSTAAMARVFTVLLSMRGLWAEALAICQAGLAAARRLGDHVGECRLVQTAAHLLWHSGELDEAESTMQTALALAYHLDDHRLITEVLFHLGWLSVDRKRYTVAVDYLLAAAALDPGIHSGRVEYLIECHLGVAHSGLGDHDKASRHIENSLALLRRTGYLGDESQVLLRLAQARLSAGDHHEAISLCEQALDREHHPSHPQDHAAILYTLGTSLHRIGETSLAIRSWRAALAIFEKFGDPRTADLCRRLDLLETT
ncbi:ATP-binding protein [Saccharothrix obliqua]|uniref:ATP-binding protein n=1 Tax=Saccharothrix obliqua TaxID=2861747 RepID=UPI001C5F580D|nr:tetratricopeptide repeat protein [Saccharothrix obliqua]MBW4722374.1 tetratricopeptide repeat protein [Saccharothrix obliqua]